MPIKATMTSPKLILTLGRVPASEAKPRIPSEVTIATTAAPP